MINLLIDKSDKNNKYNLIIELIDLIMIIKNIICNLNDLIK